MDNHLKNTILIGIIVFIVTTILLRLTYFLLNILLHYRMKNDYPNYPRYVIFLKSKPTVLQKEKFIDKLFNPEFSLLPFWKNLNLLAVISAISILSMIFY